jgi:succinate-acetate transporter protein
MSTPQTIITETKLRLSDATALGVFGLAMVTLVASSVKLHWITGTGYAIPWAVMLGSIAQIWAAKVDMKNNNYFGSIVLGAYGLFWMAVAMHWAILLKWPFDPGNSDAKAVGFAYLGYLVFSLFITVAALEVNKMFDAILVLIDLLFLGLTFSTFQVATTFFADLAAWSEFLIAILGLYTAGAIFLNGYFGRKLLWLGKPFGLTKKA